jgi:Integrase core domain
VRCDNGPEFTSRHFLAWCEDCKIGLIHIQPGRPMQNGRVESFNGRLRDECLNANWFATIANAKEKIESWRSVQLLLGLLKIFQLLFRPGIVGSCFKKFPVVSDSFVHIAIGLMRHRENAAGPA